MGVLDSRPFYLMVWSSTCVAPWKVMSSNLCIAPCFLKSISAGACTAETLCWLAVITAKQVFVKKYRTMNIIISKSRFGSISISSALSFCLLTFKHRISVCTELYEYDSILVEGPAVNLQVLGCRLFYDTCQPTALTPKRPTGRDGI